MYSASLLDAKLIVTNYFYIAKHFFENIDSWNFFATPVLGDFYTINR